LARAKQENQREENEFPTLQFQRPGLLRKYKRGQQCEQTNSAGIKRQWKTVDASFNDRSPGPLDFCQARQQRLTIVYEIKAHMGGPVAVSFLPGTVCGHLDGALRNFCFRDLAVPGQKLD